jgi:hypothetical protein
LSPQSRHGKAQHPGRKPVSRTEAAPKPERVAESAPIEAAAAAAPVPEAEPQRRTEGKRLRVAPARKKRQHGTAYRWFAAYLPLLAGLFVLLAVVWFYTGFIQAPTPAQKWVSIENKWSPARERARVAAAAADGDWVKQQAAYKDFYTQTKGWVDDVKAYTGWPAADTITLVGSGPEATGAPAGNELANFQADGPRLLTVLQRAIDAKNVYEFETAAQTIAGLDSTFTQDVYQARDALKIGNPSATALPLSIPPTPVPTPTAVTSSSPGASGSPGATPAASPSPIASPS